LYTTEGFGELELGGYCRDRDTVQESWQGLAYLCGKILKRRLPKPEVLRCGDCEREELSVEQKKYAALDAWVSLQINLAVKDLDRVNQPVDDTTPAETFVALYFSVSRKQIPSAFGYICNKTTEISPVIGAGDNAKKIKNPKRKTVSFIRVAKVMIPGLLLDQYEAPDVTLNSFGPDPFAISVRSASLRTANASIQLSEDQQQQQPDITSNNDATQQGTSEW
jgi:hypothetical protein